MAGGPCTGLQSHPPACLDIPSVTVDELQRLVPSCEAALHAHMGLCSPSRVSGCTSHAGTRWLNRDKLNSLIGINSIVLPGPGCARAPPVRRRSCRVCSPLRIVGGLPSQWIADGSREPLYHRSDETS